MHYKALQNNYIISLCLCQLDVFVEKSHYPYNGIAVLFGALPFVSPYTVDVALKISAVDKLGQNVLLKCRYGARIKAKLFFKWLYQLPREDHISDAH